MLSIVVAASRTGSGNQVPGVGFITAEELKAKVTSAEPVVILDVRGSESYANSTSRIKGAIHVSVRKLKYRLSFAPLKDVPKDRPLVTYCSCPSDEASVQAAQILQESGFKNVKALKGGWNEWQKARGPVEPRPRG
jgi:rhodanese-related sulfurtransferase